MSKQRKVQRIKAGYLPGLGDDSVATVRKAYADLDQKIVTSNSGQQESQLNRTVFVVTAKKVGTTTMNVRTGYAGADHHAEKLSRDSSSEAPDLSVRDGGSGVHGNIPRSTLVL